MNKPILIAGISITILFSFFVIIILLAGYKNSVVTPLVTFPTPTPVTAPVFPGGPTTTTNSTTKVKLVSSNPPNGGHISPTQPLIFTFNQPVATESVSFSLFPEVDYTLSSRLNSLLVTPVTPYYQDIIYSYTISTLDGDIITSGTFSSGTSPSPVQPLRGDYPNTDSLADADQRQNFPDIYLAEFVPYDGNTFAVSDDFSASPSGHYVFTVTQRVSGAKNDFLSWLKKINMTQDQINKLEVSYQ